MSAVGVAIDAIWYGGAAPDELADALLGAGILDPWPWRRRGVRAEEWGSGELLSVAGDGYTREQVDSTPPDAQAVVATVLPHHPAAGDRAAFQGAVGVRFEIAELPVDLPPDLLGVPEARLEALARPYLVPPPGVHPRSPLWAEGEAGLRWQAVFRGLGSTRPFVHVPHANPVVGALPLAALAAARTRLAGDVILAGSASAARSWARLGFAADPHFPFGVDLDRLRAPAAAVERARSALGPAPVLLYTGRVDADKALFVLLDAYAQVRAERPVTLVLAWKGGHPAVVRAVREEAARVGGVRMVEDPPPALYAALHGVASVAVTAATSPFETFGRSPAEALGLGLPLVAPRWGPLRDLLDGAPAAFPVPVSGALPRVAPDLLAEAIRSALRVAAEGRTAGASSAVHDPEERFAHTCRLVLAAAATPLARPTRPLPPAWEALDAGLGHPPPAALRGLALPSSPAGEVAREAIRATWFAGWG